MTRRGCHDFLAPRQQVRLGGLPGPNRAVRTPRSVRWRASLLSRRARMVICTRNIKAISDNRATDSSVRALFTDSADIWEQATTKAELCPPRERRQTAFDSLKAQGESRLGNIGGRTLWRLQRQSLHTGDWELVDAMMTRSA
jgi:hypothetical protein